MAYPDDRITWIKSDGTPLAHGTAATNGATYYAELPVQGYRDFWAGLEWDAVEASAFTLESASKSTSELDSYAAAGTGWTSQATNLGTISAAGGSASCDEWQVYEAQAKRWRVKRVVTTGGVVTGRCATKASV